MSLPICCPDCGHALSAEAIAAGSIQHCLACGLEFEITIHVAPRQVEEVMAMLVDDDSDDGDDETEAALASTMPDDEIAGDQAADDETEIVFADTETDALLLAAAPAPVRGQRRSFDLTASTAPVAIEDDRIARYRALHSREAKVPAWGWVATVSISILPVLAWAWNVNGIRDGFSTPQTVHSATPDEEGFDHLQHAKFREEDEPLADVYQAIEFGIVKIETRDAEGRSSGVGSGFVIDPRGLVATSFHVLSDSVAADAIFNDGGRHEIEGYAALSPGHDLAIVKLRTQPANMTVLKLGDGGPPRKATRVVAIGHPQNHAFVPTSGIVGRVVRSSQLPAKAQQFLQYAPAGKDSVWIEHDAAISPGSSGGPLVDYRGLVMGINTWVNPELKLGYALHVQHLLRLRAEVKSEIVPLGDSRLQ